jgi:hypothetical protein
MVAGFGGGSGTGEDATADYYKGQGPFGARPYIGCPTERLVAGEEDFGGAADLAGHGDGGVDVLVAQLGRVRTALLRITNINRKVTGIRTNASEIQGEAEG